jgi:hypothetical protein
MSRKNFCKVHSRAILPGQIWLRPMQGGQFAAWRVMAVAEGHAMGRYKGCVPGTVAVSDITTDWKLGSEPDQPGERQ